MKKVIKSLIAIVCFIFLMITPFVLHEGNVNVIAEQSDVFVEDLSATRKTYITSDNSSYNSTKIRPLPYKNPITHLAVCSSDNDSFDVDYDHNYTIIKINSASDFSINLSFADKVKNSSLYTFSTKERKEKSIIYENYKISSDSWGKQQVGNNKERLYANGLYFSTGEVGTGALVIQTSNDGTSWENLNKDKYSKGLYTTDVLNNYHGTTQKYYLDGSQIKKGCYVSVNFFYEVKREYTYYYTTQERYWYQLGFIGKTHTEYHYDEKEEYLNVREEYQFYVVEDNPEVITFNNLTTNDYEIAQDEESIYNLIDSISKTMQNNDLTTTGFKINITANPYLNVTVKKDDEPLKLNKIIENKQTYYIFEQSGRYEINIKSYSKEKRITLYVNTSTPDERFKQYFGDKIIYNNEQYGNEFIDYSPENKYGNMRVFDKNSDVPVFSNKLTMVLKNVNTSTIPLKGIVINKSTGKTSFVTNQTIELNQYGLYEVLFYSNSKYYDYINNKKTNISGDVLVYKFTFKIVDGSLYDSLNKQLLSTNSFNDNSVVSVSNFNPIYYSVSRGSVNKGKINIAFSNKESALNYAKELVWSEIETHIDSTGKTYWLVPNKENPLGAKVISYSGWNNAKVVNELANSMVEKHYFDLTKSSTYLTLHKSLLEFLEEGVELSDLNLKSLGKSIIVWYSKQERESATIKNLSICGVDVVQYISNYKYSVLQQDENGIYNDVIVSSLDKYFIKDTLGIASSCIVANDIYGNQYKLNYNQGIYEQLSSQNCAAGLIFITEINIYNVIISQYYLYYIPLNYQPAKLKIKCDNKNLCVTSDSLVNHNTYKEVVITNIVDYVDPYSFVRISKMIDNEAVITYLSIEEAMNFIINDSGSYEIAIIDRFGNALTFTFTIL